MSFGATFPRILLNDAGDHRKARITGDGLETNFLVLHNSTIGTGVETISIDTDQAAVLVGPVTVNCTMVVDGTLRII